MPRITAVILPVITAVPLVPYARGKAALIAVPLLLLITALPVWSCLWVLAALMGHRSLDTLGRYTRPTERDLTAALQRTSPLERARRHGR